MLVEAIQGGKCVPQTGRMEIEPKDHQKVSVQEAVPQDVGSTEGSHSGPLLWTGDVAVQLPHAGQAVDVRNGL